MRNKRFTSSGYVLTSTGVTPYTINPRIFLHTHTLYTHTLYTHTHTQSEREELAKYENDQEVKTHTK